MGTIDLLLYPLYVALFYFFFSARRKNYNDPVLQFYHKQGFWIKALSVIPFTIFNVYISKGDSYGLYYLEGANIGKMILHNTDNLKLVFSPAADFDQGLLLDRFNLGYFSAESNFMVTRITALLSIFTFGKYMVTNLVFSMISFTGVWRLYRFFYEQYPHLHKQLAIAILYLPTFVFWSSGILKDPICTGALGWITYALYEAFYKKKNLIKNVVIVLFFGYLLAVIKVYILISYVPFFILYLILKNATLIKNKFIRMLIGPTLIVVCMMMFTTIMAQLTDSLGGFAQEGLTKSINTYQKAYAEQVDATSNFSLGVEYDGSMGTLVKMAPAAIIATLYRPFIWESKKLSTLLSSFESLAIMFFTIYVFFKVGAKNFIWAIIKDPAILYCILFAVLFALFVGATTANFGTLVRYKIPCLPFYIIALFLILDKFKQTKNSPDTIQAA